MFNFDIEKVEILSRPLCLIILWHTALQILCINSLYALVNLYNLVTFQFYARGLLLLVISFLFTVVECLHYIVHSSNSISRCEYILTTVALKVIYFCFCILQSYLITLVFEITNDLLTEEINSNFLRLACLWTISFWYISDLVYNIQSKFFLPLTLRQMIPTLTDLCKLLMNSFYSSFKIYLKFILIYFMCFYFLNNDKIVNLNSSGVLSLFYGWLLSAFVVFERLTLKPLLNLFLLRPTSFVISINEQQSHLTLLSAIKSDIPLFRYLGYYDLLMISEDKTRMIQLFSLSQPGCYPVMWEHVSEEIFSFLICITDQLRNNHLITRITENMQNKKVIYHDMHNVSQIPNPTLQDQENESIWDKKTLFKFKLFSYLFEQLPENQSINIIRQNSQTLSLACRSLASLASASITEDSHGIVQKNLSKILHLLLQLRTQLNHLDVEMHQSKISKDVKLLNQSLAYSVKSSIYKLALTFGPYIKSLSLSPQDEKHFKNFIMFKEI